MRMPCNRHDRGPGKDILVPASKGYSSGTASYIRRWHDITCMRQNVCFGVCVCMLAAA